MSETVLLRRTDGVPQIRPPLHRRAALAVDPAVELAVALLLGATLYLSAVVPPRLVGLLALLCAAHLAWRGCRARRLLRRPVATVAPLGRGWHRRAG